MEQPSIFSSTLGLTRPWKITRVEVATEQPRLDIYIYCNRFKTMPCPSCGKKAVVCGSTVQSWYHGDFFNKEAYLHAEVPVLRCVDSCGCIRATIPWSHPGSRFILQKDTLSPACADCQKTGSLGQKLKEQSPSQ